jgi:hypothetical protein
MEAPAIIVHVAEEQQLRFPFEAVFRSIVRVLMDNASSEYCFAVDFFFNPKLKKGDFSAQTVASEIFEDVFGKTIRNSLVWN